MARSNIIIPWSSKQASYANESNSLGRLDREYDGEETDNKKPIFRVAIARVIDALREFRQAIA